MRRIDWARVGAWAMGIYLICLSAFGGWRYTIQTNGAGACVTNRAFCPCYRNLTNDSGQCGAAVCVAGVLDAGARVAFEALEIVDDTACGFGVCTSGWTSCTNVPGDASCGGWVVSDFSCVASNVVHVGLASTFPDPCGVAWGVYSAEGTNLVIGSTLPDQSFTNQLIGCFGPGSPYRVVSTWFRNVRIVP